MILLRERFFDLCAFVKRRYGPFWDAFLAAGRRSWQRFTPMGRLVLAGYGCTLLFVVNTRSSMNYQLFTLLLALLAVSFCGSLLAGRRKKMLEARRVLPACATAGEPLRYVIELRNTGNAPEPGLRVLDTPRMAHLAAGAGVCPTSAAGTAPRPGNRHVRARWQRLLARALRPEADEQDSAPLEGGARQEVRMTVRTPARGLLEFGPVLLAEPDPLGLFRSVTGIEAKNTLLVLPRRYAFRPLQLPGGRRYQPGGVTRAASVGESGEFVSLREYRRGDPPRHIHWRSWAKVGRPIVKEYQDEFFTRHALVLDTFPNPARLPGSADAALFEEAVSVAASLAVMERSRDSLLDLLFVGGRVCRVTAGRGLAQAGLMLEALAGVAPCLDQPFEVLGRVVLRHAPRICGCVCVLLAWDAPRRELVRALLARGVAPLVFVLVPAREALPDPGPLEKWPDRFHPLRLGRVKEDLEAL